MVGMLKTQTKPNQTKPNQTTTIRMALCHILAKSLVNY